MEALTIRQPWASAIAHGSKLVENRTWKPLAKAPFLLAIHAGMKTDQDGFRFCRMMKVPTTNLPTSAIVAVATVVGFRHLDGSRDGGLWSFDPWFFGPIGWELADVVSIEPVPCINPGSQRLWTLDRYTRMQVTQRMHESVAS